jgi:hypothetical protein
MPRQSAQGPLWNIFDVRLRHKHTWEFSSNLQVMSLTSYRAAPPRANDFSLINQLLAELQEIHHT